jgi:CheY-like chemotaxis protein
MSESEALVADVTPAMRGLLRDTLRDVGYHVSEAGSATEVSEQVHQAALASASVALLVIGAKLVVQAAVPISVAASQRWQLGLAPLKVAVLFEWGTLGTLEVPRPNHCDLVAMLEKPFHMNELEQIARIALAKVA